MIERLNKYLAELPSTNFKIVTGETAMLITVFNVNIMLFFNRLINLEVLIALFTFLAAMLGFSYTQFAKKRDTYQPAPPSGSDTEDAPAQEPTDGGSDGTGNAAQG